MDFSSKYRVPVLCYFFVGSLSDLCDCQMSHPDSLLLLLICFTVQGHIFIYDVMDGNR